MVKIKEDIYWVGHIDWDLRNFHGYSTPSGSTYNAYLILDDEPVLIDTVKHYGFDDMLSGIKKHIDPEKIKHIVSNHAEMDHSGSIDRILEYCPKAEVVCSPNGKVSLSRHFKKNWKFKVVEDFDTLCLGKRNLIFSLMPMVHWPDSMVTYSEKDCLLFSNDAFGQHYASKEHFVDEIGKDIILKEAAKYYANIVLPYGAQVQKALAVLSKLKIDVICPSHGAIWRESQDISKIISLYDQWSSYQSKAQVAIIYDTMWGSTEKIAKKLFKFIDNENIPVKLLHLGKNDSSDVVTDVMESKVIMIGSPILNNKIFPNTSGFLTYLAGLKPRKKYGFSFGSYGWAKLGFKAFDEFFKEVQMEVLDEGRYFQYVPDDDELECLEDVAKKVKVVVADIL